MRPTLLAAALVGLVSTGCVSNVSPPGSHFATSPPGARVLIDGMDSGHLTPCEIGLESGDYEIRLELPGYEPAEFRLIDSSETVVVPYGKAVGYTTRWAVFLFYPGWDMIAPFKYRAAPSPWRIYVQLDPESTSLGGI